ncbi:MAG: DNA-processing protein DprA [candidate division Zixibacteria bacterium]|nr:DNA-processing protein DprA [candidate division Zixibacteria bacterium]
MMTTPDDPRFFWLALKTVPQIGTVRYNVLIKKFGSPKAALDALPSELKQLPDFGEKVIASLKSEIDYQEASQQLDILKKSEARLVTILDEEYPAALKQIYDPPPYLLAKGELKAENSQAVAIVGSRVCTVYGRQIAEKLAAGLAEVGLTIVSGLARGIDSIAHRAAIGAGGHTIAVLGCGLNVYYPPENKSLYQQIAESGAVITEFPFGTKPEKYNFPFRNRIISGLSQGVIVVEAGRASGALSTAHHALEQNREVFAVPGNISSPASHGANELLKQGAILTTSVADVLLALGLDPSQKRKKPAAAVDKLPEAERKVYNLLTDQPLQVDNISESLDQPVAEVLALLLSLEMADLVRQLPGKLFLRAS